jgi:hypothetical protein
VQYILLKRDARHLFDDYGISAFKRKRTPHFHFDKQEVIPGTHRTYS